MTVRFAHLVEFFKDEPKLIERGENAYRSSRVEAFSYDPTVGVVKGSVRSSLKDRTYSVEVCGFIRNGCIFSLYFVSRLRPVVSMHEQLSQGISNWDQ